MLILSRVIQKIIIFIRPSFLRSLFSKFLFAKKFTKVEIVSSPKEFRQLIPNMNKYPVKEVQVIKILETNYFEILNDLFFP